MDSQPEGRHTEGGMGRKHGRFGNLVDGRSAGSGGIGWRDSGPAVGGQDEDAPQVAGLAFRTERKKRLCEAFQQLFAGSGWWQQIAADALDQLAAEGEFLLPEAIGQETKVANALKAFRQGVEQKAAQELLFVRFAVIFPLKRNLPVFERPSTFENWLQAAPSRQVW